MNRINKDRVDPLGQEPYLHRNFAHLLDGVCFI